MAAPARPVSELGQRVRAARQARELSLRALAELAGISYTGVAAVETGQVQDPGARLLYQLAAALGERVEDLLGVPRIETTARYKAVAHTKREEAARVRLAG